MQPVLDAVRIDAVEPLPSLLDALPVAEHGRGAEGSAVDALPVAEQAALASALDLLGGVFGDARAHLVRDP